MIKPEKPEVQIVLMTTFMKTCQPDGFRAGQSQTKHWTRKYVCLMAGCTYWKRLLSGLKKIQNHKNKSMEASSCEHKVILKH